MEERGFHLGRVSMGSWTLSDKLGRPLKDLRVSVTDRCNFRCVFCMPPGKKINFLARKDLLSYEEIARLVRILTNLGVRKVRITGGEPLVRSHLENLISLLSDIEQLKDIALTTNGYTLAKKAETLKKAGLKRVTVSLPSLKEERFSKIVGREVSLKEVIEGIEESKRVGLDPVKVNAVVIRGLNDDEIMDLVEFGLEKGVSVRFIEFMDVGTLNGWSLEKVVTADEMVEKISKVYDLEDLGRNKGETAYRFRIKGSAIEIGIIASVSKPFCGSCSRLRLSADGKLYTCLFASEGVNVKDLLRGGSDDEAIRDLIVKIWEEREDRYSELRFQMRKERKVEMFRVGG